MGEEAVPQDEEFRLRPPLHRVDRRALGWWAVQAALFTVPLPLTFGILSLSIAYTREFFAWATLIAFVPGLIYNIVMPVWRYRVHRWETTDQAVYAWSGWLWQRWRVVPMSRVQTVELFRSPIQQMFGLSGVMVTTASAAGAVKIKGLDREVASELLEQLTKTAEATPVEPA